MKALLNKLIVTRQAASKTTDWGLVLKSTDEADRAVVKDVGPDVKDVSVGDVVLINWNAAQKIQDEDYVLTIDNVVLVFE